MCAVIDEVGPWTEVKVEIIREYAAVFQKIIRAQSYFHPIDLDGFSGAGIMLSERSGGPVAGTPARIVEVDPPFEEYHFIEINPEKRALLESVVGGKPTVTIHAGDSNDILLNELLPTMKYESYRKGLLFLDPYGLDLDWAVVQAAGQTKCVDVLINFPIEAINRAVLWKDSDRVSPKQIERMGRFFPDAKTWRDAAYYEDVGLFGSMGTKKAPGNEPIVQAYRKALRDVAGFKYVSSALPMKIEAGPIVYYLIGASQKKQADDLFKWVFKKWKKGVRVVATELDRVD